MYNAKVLLSVAAFTGASMAQTSTTFPDPACESSIVGLFAAAPTVPPELDLPTGALNAQGKPEDYVSAICSYANELPASVLPVFATWGSSLLEYAATELASYDGVITKCIATGAAGASITSYIHSIASHPGELCKITRSPSNGTVSATPYSTPTGTGISISISTSSPATSIPTAGAARPTGVLAGAAAIGGVLGAVALL
ncbi:hypothetical protein F4824DRAFT_446072 [Ustulina deusta]|nr:hypothetical protein F4823DRAFT_472154 [Ustulina deusta]KAI3342429.1 hypothetical protein F4824DRAFT_446072 [Ustulina deusta]